MVRNLASVPHPRRALLIIGVSLAMIAALMAYTSPAGAAHGDVSLPGSDFEIDIDANLKVDHADPSIDWANVDNIRKSDAPSGSGDDAFGQGTKEDTEVPSEVTGSIPPNKSDLKDFGIYQEGNAGSGGYLHLYWARVQDPRGTTNMDFEFNKCSNLLAGSNAGLCEREAGDLLVVYELSKGGTVPELFLLEWYTAADNPTGNGAADCEATNNYPCWGGRTDLTASGDATGSINTSSIPQADSDGLGDLDPRTFGEASIDLDVIFDAGQCDAFGSAYLKSRSSDSFTAALKDFIAPEDVNITNCGTVIVRKVTDPSPDPQSASFEFTNDLETPDGLHGTFSLQNGGMETVVNVLAGDYAVTESDPTADGFDLTSIDCSASDIAVNTNVGSRQASFTMAADATVDCTFTNTLQLGSITVVKNTIGGDGTFPFTSTKLGSFSLTTVGNTASTLFSDLLPGTYGIAETVPDGWDLTSASCDDDDGADPATIVLDPGENITCTFENTQRGKITVDKVTNPAGSSQSFGFELTGPDAFSDLFSLTDSAATHDSGFIKPGTYQVTETLPTGEGVPLWYLDGATCGGAYVNGADLVLGAGQTIDCTFNNSTGAILITKVAKDVGAAGGESPLAGVTFEVSDAAAELVATVVTDVNGEACVDGLVVGADYTITETLAPPGFDPTAVLPQTVAATAADGCGESDAGTPAAADFSNDPLSEIVITFNSLAGDGTLTVATSVVCSGPSIAVEDEEGGPLANTESATYTNLVEGTYNCTIVIDP